MHCYIPRSPKHASTRWPPGHARIVHHRSLADGTTWFIPRPCFLVLFSFWMRLTILLVGQRDLAVVNLGLDLAGVLAVYCAADGHGRAEHLLHGALEVLGHGAGAHGAGDLDDLVEGDVATVLDCAAGTQEP